MTATNEALRNISENSFLTNLQTQIMPTAITYGHKTVTTAGTAVVLGTSTSLKQGLAVQPLSTNTGLIYIGNSSVLSTNGFELPPGHPGVFIPIDNLAGIYVNSAVNGEGVSFIGG